MSQWFEDLWRSLDEIRFLVGVKLYACIVKKKRSKLSWKTEFRDWVRQDFKTDCLLHWYIHQFSPRLSRIFSSKSFSQESMTDATVFHVCLITWTKFKLFDSWLSVNKIWAHHNLPMCHCKTKQYFKRSFPVSSRFLLTGNKLSGHFMYRSIISWTPFNKLLQVLKWSLLWSLLLFCFSPASALAELRKMSLETK